MLNEEYLTAQFLNFRKKLVLSLVPFLLFSSLKYYLKAYKWRRYNIIISCLYILFCEQTCIPFLFSYSKQTILDNGCFFLPTLLILSFLVIFSNIFRDDILYFILLSLYPFITELCSYYFNCKKFPQIFGIYLLLPVYVLIKSRDFFLIIYVLQFYSQYYFLISQKLLYV